MTTAAYKVVDGRYGALTVFANDTGAVTQSLLIYGEWAENEIDFLRHFVTTGSTVLDVGAYIGTHTLAFARAVGSTGRVIAIEAQPDTFDVLKRNVLANVMGDAASSHPGIVQLENAIVSDRLGEIIIPAIDVERENSFGSASLLETLTGGPPALDDDIQGRARVQSITIDSLDLQSCALVKLDVEGVEDIVLRGAVQTLQRCSPVIYCECNTLAAGLKSLAVLESIHYKVFAHVVQAFNSNNFFNAGVNIFGEAREVALVGIPAARAHDIRRLPLRPSELLLDVEEADDLALALLNKPQYSSEVLRLSRAAKTGGAKFLNRLQNEEQHTLAQRLLRAHEENVASIKEKDRAITELHVLLTQRDADIEKLQEMLAQRDRDNVELHELLTRRDVDIASLQCAVSDKERDIVEAHATILQRDADLAILKSYVRQKHRT